MGRAPAGRRGYYPNGALKGDTSRVRSYSAFELYGVSTYALEYTYDLSGRRVSRKDNGTTSQLYAYDALGQLASTSALQGDTVAVTFSYDSLGRLRSQSVPAAGTSATWTYDLDGRPPTRIEAGFADSMHYDARGKRVGVMGQLVMDGLHHGTALMAYDGLGQLVASVTGERERRTTDAFTLDPLGNMRVGHANRLEAGWPNA